MQDVVFVVNPRAASGRAAVVWERLRRAHGSLETAAVVEHGDPRQAAEHLRSLLHEGVRRVVVVGGVVHSAIAANVLLSDERATQVSLGLVPVGSGSDTARGLGLAARPDAALQRAVNGAARPLDVLRLNAAGQCRYVVNIASLGISGPVAARVNRYARRWAGTYLWTALREVARFRAPEVRVRVDGRPYFAGPVVLLAVANGCAFGRGMRIAPQACSDDGVADLVLAEAVPWWRLAPAIARLYRGRHLGLDFVHAARGQRVAVDAAAPLAFELDGETLTAQAVELELVPAALHLAR